MADEKVKEVKPVVFILVQSLGKTVMNGGVIVSQDVAIIENGQVVKTENTDRLDPSPVGVFEWKDDHWNHKRRMKRMNDYKIRKNKGETPFIMGPYSSTDAAFKAMHKARPKAPAEENAVLKAENATQESTIAELREKLAAATVPKSKQA